MALIEINDFNFSYNGPDGEKYPCLKDINLEINEGDFILLCGPSGCGKTTLLSNLKKELIPEGIRTGNAKYAGKDIEKLDELTSACDIGYLFQNPDSQLVMDTVIQEIAFPLENIAVPTGEIRNRVSEIVTFFGINDILHKNVNDLSGGQKQLVNLCSLLVLRPKVLLLDEPISQLDPIAAYDFLNILRRLNEEFSISIILSSHQFDNVYSFINRVVFMEKGEIKYSDSPYSIPEDILENDLFRHYLPSVTKVYNLLSDKYPALKNVKIPFSIREGRQCLSKIKEQISNLNNANGDLDDFDLIDAYENQETLIKMENVYFAYERHSLILKNVTAEIRKGEYIGLIGGNGSGKSTLLELMAGLLKPIKGKIDRKKDLRIGFIYQNPMIHFSKDSVKKELISSLRVDENFKDSLLELTDEEMIGNEELNSIKFDNLNFNFRELLELFGLKELLSHHPYDCSGGEQQKIVIMKVLLEDCGILIMDEPTKALDPISSCNLSKILKNLQKNGISIVMSSHDLNFIANNCERCLMLFDKDILIDNYPKCIFRENNFYTTFVNRMVKDYCPKCITVSDVCKVWDL